MNFLRVLYTESLKLRRTTALKMAVLGPAVVVLLALFLASQAPFSTVRRSGVRDDWLGLAQFHFLFWTLLMMPLLITLETALLAGVDHANNQWKSLFARPVPRWTFYIAKLILVVFLIGSSTLLLVPGILMDGAVLPHIQGQLTFKLPFPWRDIFSEAGTIVSLSFLALAIQHWISLRWRAFSVAVGSGAFATVVGYFAAVATSQQNGSWMQYFPWTLPTTQVLARTQPGVETQLLASVGFGIVVSVIGCVDFCRRDVQ
jgi:lantibiotic transport system permease protein